MAINAAIDTGFGFIGGTRRDYVGPWLSFWLPLAIGALVIVVAAVAPEFQRRYVDGELGIFESAQAAILACAAIAAVRLVGIAVQARGAGLMAWSIWLLLGCIYVLGEEISWGQHYAGWATEGFFAARNDQSETNLHNMTSWLDQKPRLMLLLGVIIGGLVHPLLKARRGRGLIERPRWLFPTAVCAPVAALAVLAQMPETLRDLGLFDRALFRESELQEIYFYLFILIYLLSLTCRMRPASTPARASL